jgi:hypothetical protein
MIRDKGDWIEFDIIIEKTRNKKVKIIGPDGSPLKDEKGNFIKETIEEYTGINVLPTTFLKEGITLHGSVLNGRNKLLKTRATVYDKYTQKFYLVKHRPEEVEQKLNQRSSVGFQFRR